MLQTVQAVPPARPVPPPCAAPPPADGETAAIRQSLLQILASAGFHKAQRMSRLLTFLVEKRLAGAVRDTNEYAIGIEVFDRDPSTYSTCGDPIVRVQVGRLREKLKHYYATTGQADALRFSIPIGSYMPEIEPMHSPPPALGGHYLLAVAPLAYYSGDPDGVAFTHGLNEELAYQLFKAFGQTIVSHTFHSAAAAPRSSHRLEGSVRRQGERIRTSARLIDCAAGCIVWSEQFDHVPPFDIALQEEIAAALCQALARYCALG